ncbi:unnamed protein product [Gordionus sp. m RMFG-2023]
METLKSDVFDNNFLNTHKNNSSYDLDIAISNYDQLGKNTKNIILNSLYNNFFDYDDKRLVYLDNINGNTEISSNQLKVFNDITKNIRAHIHYQPNLHYNSTLTYVSSHDNLFNFNDILEEKFKYYLTYSQIFDTHDLINSEVYNSFENTNKGLIPDITSYNYFKWYSYYYMIKAYFEIKNNLDFQTLMMHLNSEIMRYVFCTNTDNQNFKYLIWNKFISSIYFNNESQLIDNHDITGFSNKYKNKGSKIKSIKAKFKGYNLIKNSFLHNKKKKIKLDNEYSNIAGNNFHLKLISIKYNIIEKNNLKEIHCNSVQSQLK